MTAGRPGSWAFPPLALMGSFWRERRRALLALLGILGLGAVGVRCVPDLRTSEAARHLVYIPFVLSLFTIYAVSAFTESSRRGARVGYPARLFVLPLSTFALVTWPMAAALATVVGAYLGWAGLVLRPLDIVLPLGWVGGYLAAGMSAFMAAVWCLSRLRVARLLFLGCGGTLFALAWVVLTDEAANSWMGPYLPGGSLVPVRWGLLAGLTIVPYGIALWGVGRQRRGTGFRLELWARLLEIAGGMASQRRERHATARQALAWSEWRRHGIILPLGVGTVLTLLLAGSWVGAPLGPATTQITLLWILATPLVVAWAVGKGFGKIDLWARDPGFPVFLATRPVPDGDWIVVKSGVALRAAVVSWLLVAGFVPAWLALACEGAPLREVWNLMPADLEIPRLGAWMLLLAAAMTITWRLLVGSLYLGLSGKRGLLTAATCLVFAGGFSLLMGGIWIADDPSLLRRRWTIPGWAPWAVVVVFAIRMATAALLVRRATRQGGIGAGAVLVYLGAWLADTAGFLALVWLLFPAGGWPRALAAMGALFVMPALRLSLAPWMAAANRHGHGRISVLSTERGVHAASPQASAEHRRSIPGPARTPDPKRAEARGPGCLLGLGQVGDVPHRLSARGTWPPGSGPAAVPGAGRRREAGRADAALPAVLGAFVLLSVGVAIGLAVTLAQALPRMVRVEGRELRFLVEGGRGPTVVLWGAEGWGRIRKGIRGQARVVTFESVARRGEGATPAPDLPSEAAGQLRAGLAVLNIDPPYLLVGHSFGGALARVFAARHPSEVNGLVLIDPFQEEFLDWLRVHQPAHHDEFVRRGESNYAPDWGRAMEELRAASHVAEVPVVLLTAAHRVRQPNDSMEAEISADDWEGGAAAIVEAHRQWVSRIPGARLVEIEGASHNLPREHPDRVIRTIEELLRRSHRTPAEARP